jgi:hypothetical protein
VSPSSSAITLSVGLAARRAFALALFEDQHPAGVHAATVTIFGSIGTPGFEPERIAQRYLDIHHEPQDQWSPESLLQ